MLNGNIASKWIAAADMVRRAANETLAVPVFDYLRQNCYQGRIALSTIVMDDVPVGRASKDLLTFLPLYEVDAERMPEFGDFMRDEVLAGYFPRYNAIGIKMEYAVSEVWKGLTMLHLGYAALWNMTKGKNFGPGMEEAKKHEHTHAVQLFEIAVSSAYGGQMFDGVIDAGIEYIQQQMRDQGLSLAEAAGHLVYHPRHDEIFGPSLSEYEKWRRAAHFITCTGFTFLERHAKGNVKQQQCAFLSEYFKHVRKKAGFVPLNV